MSNFQTLEVAKPALPGFVDTLVKRGAASRQITNPYMLWTGTVGQSIVTVYSSGKIVFDIKDQAGQELFKQLGGLESQKQTLTLPTRPWALGFDETGTGELFGRIVLGGALASKESLEQLLPWLKRTNTKVTAKSDSAYWLEKEGELRHQLSSLPDVVIKTDVIENSEFVKPKIKNKLMDQHYLSNLIEPAFAHLETHKVSSEDIEMVIDDYKLGVNLRSHLQKLSQTGVSMVIEHKADDHFAIVRLAAISARIARAREMDYFNSPEFEVNGVLPGNGNVGAPQTREWLRAWRTTGKPWPDFVKQWFKTINEV